MAASERNLTAQAGEWLRGQRRTISGLLSLLVLAMLTLGGVRWMSDPVRFPLSVVEVKGEFRYLMKDALQAAIAPHVTGGFFTVDVAAIRTAAEQLPWVNTASVKRVWPATLRIQIDEQQPVAHWGEHGYLNAAGVAFFPEREAATPELPWLSGPSGQEQKVLEQYHEVAAILTPFNMPVTRIALDERRAWTVRLGDSIELQLGRAEPWKRLQRFVRAIPGVFSGRLAEVQRVDLRYGNGFAVLWNEIAADSVKQAQAQKG